MLWFNPKFVLKSVTVLAYWFALSVQAQESTDQTTDLANRISNFEAQYTTQAMTSPLLAEKALEDVSLLSEQLKSWYSQAERTCYDQFFVNSCIIEKKQMRRRYSTILQNVKFQAKALQRKLHIEQLDVQQQEKNTQARTKTKQ